MSSSNNEENVNYANRIRSYRDLMEFQLTIAERWLNRGDNVEDIFAKFFFYFAGFNSVYFLWRKIDAIDRESEVKHIENLLKKFDEPMVQDILKKMNENIIYFINRTPIQRMDSRNIGNQLTGNDSEGEKCRIKLSDKQETERLIAIGSILYFVRSNLVHGSKKDSGDDRKIIENAIEPLKIILLKSISLTRKHQYL